MLFEIPEEVAAYLAELDDFIEREIKPIEQRDDNIRFFDHRREHARTEFREDVWKRWLAYDPIAIATEHADALRSLRMLFLDCGTRDEFHLHHGTRMLARRLASLGIPHEHLEYDDGHMNVGYRYDVSLPRLAAALGAPTAQPK
jgi:enterochelin esterase family protein